MIGKKLIIAYRGQPNYSFRDWTLLPSEDSKRYIACEVFDVNIGKWMMQVIALNTQNRIVINILAYRENIMQCPDGQYLHVGKYSLAPSQIKIMKTLLDANQKLQDDYINTIYRRCARRAEFQRENIARWRVQARAIYEGDNVKHLIGYDPDVGSYDPNTVY